MAQLPAEFPTSRLSESDGTSDLGFVMDPLVSVQIQSDSRAFQPGEKIVCDYQIDAVAKEDLQSIEASILWYTQGKGDEDMGVHYFERRVPADAEDNDLRTWRRFEVALPNSPLSYDGELIQVRWLVRVRAFLKHGKQYLNEMPFVLGDAIPVGFSDSNASTQ